MVKEYIQGHNTDHILYKIPPIKSDTDIFAY